jgi:hypothetical protein
MSERLTQDELAEIKQLWILGPYYGRKLIAEVEHLQAEVAVWKQKWGKLDDDYANAISAIRIVENERDLARAEVAARAERMATLDSDVESLRRLLTARIAEVAAKDAKLSEAVKLIVRAKQFCGLTAVVYDINKFLSDAAEQPTEEPARKLEAPELVSGDVLRTLRASVNVEQAESERPETTVDEMVLLLAEADRVSDRLREELAHWKQQAFRPLGDNHHNAALCPYCNPILAKQEQFQSESERLRGVLDEEKSRRIYYQDIVYAVCNALDRIDGRKPGQGIVCGTFDSPSDQVQRRMEALEKNL